MIIGIDLDSTLIDNPVFDITFKEYNSNLTNENITDWDLTCIPINIRNEIFKRFSNPYYMCNDTITPIKNTKKKLMEWKKENHTLKIITARSKNIRLETRRLVNRLFPKIDKLIFVELNQSKKNKFKKEKIDVWIDDNPTDCKTAIKMGIDTYLISNNKTKYNWKLKGYKNIKHVKNIYDIKLNG